MKNYLVFITFLFVVNQLPGQVSITFQLNTKDLREDRLFSYDSGDRVFIRGSFNDWKGTNYELIKSETSDIFSGEFTFENIGDTISYKFIIKKDQNRFFSETNPNPDNLDNGNRQLIIDEDDIVLSPTRFHYDEYFSFPVIFSEKKLKEDFQQFRSILETTHPALYDFTPKEVLDSIFDYNYELINSELDFSTFLILMSEVISKVGCGHTNVWVPREFWNVAPSKLFPLKLLITDNQTLVTGSFSNTQDIPVGSKILSINNQPMQLITKRLASLTPSDGLNRSYRLAWVSQYFSLNYAFTFGFFDNLNVEYLIPGNQQKSKKIIHPVSRKAFYQGKPDLSELSFKQIEETNTGVLTINTFGYYSEVDMFYSFIDSVFQEINKNEIKNLVLDLRGNSGGDPFCASYLWGYLESKPLPYFEEHYGEYDTLANPVPKPINNFKGELYTLIDGNGFSTTGHLCGLLKYHKVGTFIGSELGSTYTCTGDVKNFNLKNTGIILGTAVGRRYSTAVDDMNPRRGVMPDYPVELTQNDIIEGRDAVMEFAFSLIKSKR